MTKEDIESSLKWVLFHLGAGEVCSDHCEGCACDIEEAAITLKDLVKALRNNWVDEDWSGHDE